MKYLLDTNICIYLIKKKPESVIRRMLKLDPQALAISAVTWSELIYGAEKSNQSEKNRKALKDFVSVFEILPWTAEQAETAGHIRAELEKNGHPIGPFDLQIAAHAVSLGLTLVTNNEKEFRRIKSLKFESWVRD